MQKSTCAPGESEWRKKGEQTQHLSIQLHCPWLRVSDLQLAFKISQNVEFSLWILRLAYTNMPESGIIRKKEKKEKKSNR